ncbi:MAG: hypothetical protein ACR2J5_16310 [Geodermatophilaceae bacterium]
MSKSLNEAVSFLDYEVVVVEVERRHPSIKETFLPENSREGQLEVVVKEARLRFPGDSRERWKVKSDGRDPCFIHAAQNVNRTVLTTAQAHINLDRLSDRATEDAKGGARVYKSTNDDAQAVVTNVQVDSRPWDGTATLPRLFLSVWKDLEAG